MLRMMSQQGRAQGGMHRVVVIHVRAETVEPELVQWADGAFQCDSCLVLLPEGVQKDGCSRPIAAESRPKPGHMHDCKMLSCRSTSHSQSLRSSRVVLG